MVELISYYTQNSLKESFAGLSKSEEDNRNWKLKLMFKKTCKIYLHYQVST